MNEIVKLIVDNGATLVLLAYFIFKDYKFTEKISITLSSIDNSLKERNKK